MPRYNHAVNLNRFLIRYRPFKHDGKNNNTGEEHFYAVVVSNKEVQSADQEEILKWLSGADKEAKTLIERGVLRLVPISALDDLDSELEEALVVVVVVVVLPSFASFALCFSSSFLRFSSAFFRRSSSSLCFFKRGTS